jgi:4-hydroxy-3-polyprenylbenzoate decarboxylase
VIVAREDNPNLDIHDIPAFLRHVLERVDWRTDLHFQTRTTIDTLDYSGTGLNEGSKVVIAAAGPPFRNLPTALPDRLVFPDGFTEPRVMLPGILTVQGPAFSSEGETGADRFCGAFQPGDPINAFPLVVLVDDSEFTARTLNNWLWVTFTRSNPAADVHGIGAFMHQKHWGCEGALVIDARIKPHHAPPLEEDPDVRRRVDVLAAPGGPLYRII